MKMIHLSNYQPMVEGKKLKKQRNLNLLGNPWQRLGKMVGRQDSNLQQHGYEPWVLTN